MKKNFKRFFTLKHKANDGFTLVELIVVIAILAILGGVAVPVYSGYITKAERAADDELLASLNTAFASACAMSGQDHYGRDDANAPMTNVEGGRTATVTVTGIEGFDEDFAGFYEGGVFKVYTDLNYNALLGLFEGMDEAAIIEALKQYIANSNFNGHLEELTGDVGALIDILSGYLEEEGIGALVGTGFDEYLTDVLGMSDADKANPNKMANAAVLYLANSAAKMTDENILNAKMTLADAMIQRDLSQVIENLSVDTDSGLASYAMLYATAEALALKEGPNSDAYKALKEAEINDPVGVINAVSNVFIKVSDSTIEQYVGEGNGSEFDKDMDAYFETMQAVNTKENQLKNELDQGGLLTENETVKDMIGDLQS